MCKNRLLVLKKDKHNLPSYERKLKKEGYKTEFAFSGPEAIQKFSTYPYDMVILDILPDINLLELMNSFHRVNDKIPIIINNLSGSAKKVLFCGN